MRPGDTKWVATASTAISSFRQAADRIDNGLKALRELRIPTPDLFKLLEERAAEFRNLAEALTVDRDRQRAS